MKAKTIKAVLSKKVDEWIESIKDETLREQVRKGTIVTGGCIASMLLQEPVNDYDIYFRNMATAEAVARYYVSEFNASKGYNLQVDNVDGRVRIVKHVGEAAGGTVRRDLFDDRNAGWVNDAVLLDQLVSSKLDAVAEEVRAEGWSWVEIRPVNQHPTGNRDPHPKCPQDDDFIGLNSFGVGSPSAPIGTPLDGQISVYEQRITSDLGGGPGWVLIHTLGDAMHRVGSAPTQRLDPACAANIVSLVEIRDNAVHFLNDDQDVCRRVHELGCACLRNYAAAVAEWFDQDLSQYRFMILPLSFEGAAGALAVPGRKSQQATKLFAYLDQTANDNPATDSGRYAVAIQVETRIVGSRAKDAVAVRLGGGPNAPEVRLTEEQIRTRFPHDDAIIVERAKARRPALKLNAKFNNAMRTVKDNPHLTHKRLLDPNNLKSSKKEFYADGAVDALLKALDTPAL